MTVNEEYMESLAEIMEYLEGKTPDKACAWDLAATICQKNGWIFKSGISGIEWAAFILMLDKVTTGERT